MCTFAEIVTFSHTSTILHDIIHQPSPCGSGKGVWASLSTQWLAFGQSAGDPWWSGRHYAAGWWQTQGELLAGGMMDNGNSWKRCALHRRFKGLMKFKSVWRRLEVPVRVAKDPRKTDRVPYHGLDVLLRNSDILCRLTLAVFNYWMQKLKLPLSDLLLNVESIFCVGILAPKPLGDPKTCQAWLPQEQIRPLVGPSETEILEALCNSVASEAEFFVRQSKTSRFDRMPGFFVEDVVEFFGCSSCENEANRWKYGWTRDCFTLACQWPLCGRRKHPNSMGTPKERTQAPTCRRLGAQQTETENFKGNASIDNDWYHLECWLFVGNPRAETCDVNVLSCFILFSQIRRAFLPELASDLTCSFSQSASMDKMIRQHGQNGTYTRIVV